MGQSEILYSGWLNSLGEASLKVAHGQCSDFLSYTQEERDFNHESQTTASSWLDGNLIHTRAVYALTRVNSNQSQLQVLFQGNLICSDGVTTTSPHRKV